MESVGETFDCGDDFKIKILSYNEDPRTKLPLIKATFEYEAPIATGVT
jgi:hypothetical protein